MPSPVSEWNSVCLRRSEHLVASRRPQGDKTIQCMGLAEYGRPDKNKVKNIWHTRWVRRFNGNNLEDNLGNKSWQQTLSNFCQKFVKTQKHDVKRCYRVQNTSRAMTLTLWSIIITVQFLIFSWKGRMFRNLSPLSKSTCHFLEIRPKKVKVICWTQNVVSCPPK